MSLNRSVTREYGHIHTLRQNSLTHMSRIIHMLKSTVYKHSQINIITYMQTNTVTHIPPFFFSNTHLMIHPDTSTTSCLHIYTSFGNLWVTGLSILQHLPCMGHHEFVVQTIDGEILLLQPYKTMPFRSRGNPNHFHMNLLPFSPKLSTVLKGP